MAFSNVTILEARLAAQNTIFAENNQRTQSFEALPLMLQGAQMLVPGLADIKKASAQATKVPVFARVAPGTGATRKCTFSGTATPSLQTISWTTILEEFALNDVEHQNSMVSYQQGYNFNYMRKSEAVYTRLLEDIQDSLEANASTTNDGTFFPAISANVKTIPNERINEVFNGVAAEMKDNRYFGRYVILGNYNFNAQSAYIRNQGPGNSANLLASVDEFTFAHLPITNASGMIATFYVFELGTVGMVPWIRSDYRTGNSIDGSHIKTTTRLPGVRGLPAGLTTELTYEKHCEGEAEYVEGWGLSLDHAEVFAYDEDSGVTPVMKYQIEAAA